jgi:hypothetical protein
MSAHGVSSENARSGSKRTQRAAGFRAIRERTRASRSSPPSAQLRTGSGDRYAAASRFLARWLTASAPTNTCGYGSLRSQGRRTVWCVRRFKFQTTAFLAVTASRSRRGIRASFSENIPLSASRGRRERRALDAPAASYAVKNKAYERNHHGHTGSPGIPYAMVYDLFRALPGDRACLSPSPTELPPST